jgi:hypothetical protein
MDLTKHVKNFQLVRESCSRDKWDLIINAFMTIDSACWSQFRKIVLDNEIAALRKEVPDTQIVGP